MNASPPAGAQGARDTRSAGPAALRVRSEVRAFLTDPRHGGHIEVGSLAVAVSGGADSLALTDAAVHACGKLGVEVHALVVDHGLQEGSERVAREAAATAEALGVRSARVLPVQVSGAGGPEGAARRARYAALRGALPAAGALVLLGHTLDDQAETVLLGLGRGSGPRSVAGMRALDPPWARPLLGVPRAITARACAELGVVPWSDPHNCDPRFTRVRLRTEVLPLLEEVLRGGVGGALARTAAQLREDLEALDDLGDALLARAALPGDALLARAEPPPAELPAAPPTPAEPPPAELDVPAEPPPAELDVPTLAAEPAAVRRRALRGWLLAAGVRELSDQQLRAVDALVHRWRGQGGVWLPGDLVVSRAHGRLHVRRADPTHADRL